MKHHFKSAFAAVAFGIALVSGAVLPLSAQDAPIYSLRDRFQPVTAQNGMVASQEAVATGVGVDILKKAATRSTRRLPPGSRWP